MGESPAIRRVLEAARTAAAADYPVLIEGESGTGKELVARLIHSLSPRSKAPFVGENCAALPEALAEAECFGHERGAFTGAICQQEGLFERAHCGTLFLDEVGEMPLMLQKKLLRVLQERQVRRVGGREPISVDFRLVSATNRCLETMVRAGEFRRDLYYRIHAAIISMPSLRERAADVPLLLTHFAEAFALEGRRRPISFTPAAVRALSCYHWPGNVRELRNEVLRLACSGIDPVDVGALSSRIVGGAAGSADRSLRSGSATSPLSEIERQTLGTAILDAIHSSEGNLTAAARKLQITRTTLYRRIERYGLHPEVLRLSAARTGHTRISASEGQGCP